LGDARKLSDAVRKLGVGGLYIVAKGSDHVVAGVLSVEDVSAGRHSIAVVNPSAG
jgi:hypothetical protein